LIQYTGKTATTLTGLTRGVNETTAAVQGDGASVTEVGGWELWLDATCSGAGGSYTLQDFTGYTEVDPNARITVTAGKLDVNGMTDNEDAYVYKDFGADYFGTLTHKFKFTKQAQPGGSCCLWMVANSVDEYRPLRGHAGAYSVELAMIGTVRLWGDVNGFSTGLAPSTGTPYWAVVSRIGGTVTLMVYSDAGLTTQVGATATRTVSASTDYRYLYGFAAWNNGVAENTISVDIENLNISAGGGTYDAVGWDASTVGMDDGTEGDLLQDDGVDDVPVSEGTAYLFKLHVIDSVGNTNTEVGGVDQLESYGPDCYLDGDGDAGQGLEGDEVWNARINAKPRRRFR